MVAFLKRALSYLITLVAIGFLYGLLQMFISSETIFSYYKSSLNNLAFQTAVKIINNSVFSFLVISIPTLLFFLSFWLFTYWPVKWYRITYGYSLFACITLLCLKQIHYKKVLQEIFFVSDANTIVQEFISTPITPILTVAIIIFSAIILKRLRKSAPNNHSDSPIQPLLKKHYQIILPRTLVKILSSIAIIFSLAWATVNIIYGMNSYSIRKTVANKPNIIYIMVDTLRADHLSCYGYKRQTSPNIDMLSKDALRFDTAIAHSSWTTASVTSFMSGRYNRIRWANSMPQASNINYTFLTQHLKNHGYSTCYITSNPNAGKAYGFAKDVDIFDECYDSEISSPDVAKTAINRLDQLKDKRFFMFMLFLDPHQNYLLHKQYDYMPEYHGKIKGRYNVRQKDLNWLTKSDLEYIKSLYDSEISYTDYYIGKVLNHIKKLNLYNDTLIVFLADHGEEFGEHDCLDHGRTLYDSLIKVPLIIKLPGKKEKKLIKGPFALVNLMPSVTNYIGIDLERTENLDGRPVDLANVKKINDGVIYSYTDFEAKKTGAKIESLRCSKHKYIKNLIYKKLLLFDIINDKNEKHDISNAYTDVINNFNNLADKINKQNNLSEAKSSNDSSLILFTKDEKQRLRSLGYLN